MFNCLRDAGQQIPQPVAILLAEARSKGREANCETCGQPKVGVLFTGSQKGSCGRNDKGKCLASKASHDSCLVTRLGHCNHCRRQDYLLQCSGMHTKNVVNLVVLLCFDAVLTLACSYNLLVLRWNEYYDTRFRTWLEQTLQTLSCPHLERSSGS